jgi:formate dehydrogenase iron-sulfur subunit
VPTLTRIYVPADSAALALGADDVATAIAAEAKRLGRRR